LKQNFAKPILCWTLFVIAIGWLFFAWIPMMRPDNHIDPQKVLQDSQAKIDEVRSKLHDLQMQEDNASTWSESQDK
jgi:hypothetical protein